MTTAPRRTVTAPAGRPPTVVIGAGPTGLACARELTRQGVHTVVLERGAGAGEAWRRRYRSLRLNSGRPFSSLPGSRFPRGVPMFPPRDAVVAYLEAYGQRHGITVQARTTAQRVDRDGTGWAVRTDRGTVLTDDVVVATGLWSRPEIPHCLTVGDTSVPVLHSAFYVDAEPYRGREVLVVGAGSTGMEIAHELVRGGAAAVHLSVRTPPTVLPRAVAGLPGDPGVRLLERMPPRLADRQVRLLSRLTVGDLADVGLPAPSESPFTRVAREGDGTPSVVDREVVDDLRARRIHVVPATVGREDGAVVLADGSSLRVDAVIAATGYRTGLEPLVGHLGVLDARGHPLAHDEHAVLPGLHLVNFRPRPGLLGAARGCSRRTARAIARDRRRRGDAAPGRALQRR
jgi:putative flavoprotein involved in K+ transport